MSDYNAYRDRVTSSGATMQEAIQLASKRKIVNDMLNSPSLSYVRLNDSSTLYPSLVSDRETFYSLSVLFLPDTALKVGDYVHYNSATYLATDQKKDSLYPQLYVELCNETFVMQEAGTRVITGYDEFNRPIYRVTNPTEHRIPCVMSTKIYSIVENSAIPLPDGAMIMKLPYNPQRIPSINYQFSHRNSQFKITTISYEKVINEVGFIEVRLQRET